MGAARKAETHRKFEERNLGRKWKEALKEKEKGI